MRGGLTQALGAMDKLQLFAKKLHQLRWILALSSAIGFCVTGLTLFLVPSNLGFALAGPLVVFPWCLMSIAFARKLSNQSMLFILFCSAVGLAWPVIVLLG
nr:putative integron gene cassette protein [uncultured bacterium]CAS03051.1 putative integron gene cassette protein [uncultured bacterium]